MNLSKNFLAGVLSSIWTSCVGLMIIPFYIKYLGLEAYGLIGFLVTLQAIFSFLDMGFTPALSRQIARCKALGDMYEARILLGSLSVIYLFIAILIVVITILLAPIIATYWLKSNSLNISSISHAVMLMGFVIACRWPLGLYQGALIGMQRIDITSAVSVIMATISGVGGVGVVSYISPTIEALFIWQAVMAFIYTLIIRLFALNNLGWTSTNFKFSSLRHIWRFSIGMSGITITGLILLQMDKLLVSKMVDLVDFGKYALAGTIASGLYVLMAPLFNVVYPRMSELVASEQLNKLIVFYKNSSYLFMAIFAPLVVSTILFSGDFLVVWTGNKNLALSTTPITQFIIIGTALNGIMHFPYALQLAYGATYLAIVINIILIAITVPLTIVLTKYYGVIGGAGAWAILNGLYILIGTVITHRVLLRGYGLTWILHDILVPIVISVVVITFGRVLLINTLDDSLYRLILSSVFAVISFIGIVFVSSISRNIFLKKINAFFGKE